MCLFVLGVLCNYLNAFVSSPNMKHMLIFLVRVLIFHCVFLSKLFVRKRYALRLGVDAQILVSSVQMCVVVLGVMVFRLSVMVVSTINDGRHYTTVEEDEEEECGNSANADAVVDVADTEASNEPTRVQHKIEFADSASLRVYVLFTHFIGLLLWGTFYAFDFGTTLAFYWFVYGLLIGWLVRIWRSGPEVNTVLCVVYIGLFATVMGVNRPQLLDLIDTDTLCFAVLLPIVFGIGWMNCVSHERIVENVENSLVTSVLVCCIVMATSDWTPLFALLARERVLFVYVLFAEPLLKSLALSVLVLSVLTRHHQQILFAFICVYALACYEQGQTTEPVLLATSFIAVLSLLTVQCVRICRTSHHTVV